MLDQVGNAKLIMPIPVTKEDRHKTAFFATKGLTSLELMLFGLYNMSTTFQNMIDQGDQFASAYLDIF